MTVKTWVAEHDLMSLASRARRLVSLARAESVNLYSVAERSMEQLRDAAVCIANHVHSLTHDGMPAAIRPGIFQFADDRIWTSSAFRPRPGPGLSGIMGGFAW